MAIRPQLANLPSRPGLRSALMRRRNADKLPAVLLRSDGAGAFGEDRCELMPWVNIYAEFIVAVTEVLHERVSGTDHPCRAESFRPRIGRSRAFRRP
jgi:hypothetical protein